MIDEERKLIMALIFESLPAEDFLKQFRSSVDGSALGLELLKEAADSETPEDVEYALLVGFFFGLNQNYLETLITLSSEKWHYRHEDVVTALGELATPDAVDALHQATQWIPNYLDYDDARALAVKAIWALGGIEGKEADEALRRLAESGEPILHEEAEKQLRIRSAS